MKKNKEFEAWFCEEQVENTLFPLLGKLYKEHKSILQSVWEASAKVQQLKIDSLQAELDKVSQPVTDEQIGMLGIAYARFYNGVSYHSELYSAIRSILERK